MKNCPKCGCEDLHREEADVGVGIIYGPYGCPECGWSEWKRYDHSDGEMCEAQKEHPGWYVDQWGRMQRISAIEEKLESFGISSDGIDDLFNFKRKSES